MENPEEILHSLEEFSKFKPKDIPGELEDYLRFVAKTGDPVYQWPVVKTLFREKLLNVITEFYESCPSVEIPPCQNVEMFNYESMKTFILEKLDTFVAAPFTVQRICELLTTPKKEYNRIDKYMRALEKNILVVSTTEPGHRITAENGEGIVNGIESEHLPEVHPNNDINVEEMDDGPTWPKVNQNSSPNAFETVEANLTELQTGQNEAIPDTFEVEARMPDESTVNSTDTVIISNSPEQLYGRTESAIDNSGVQEDIISSDDNVIIGPTTPALVQKRRDSIEPIVSTDEVPKPNVSADINKEDVREDAAGNSTIPSEIEMRTSELVTIELTDKDKLSEFILQSEAKEETLPEISVNVDPDVLVQENSDVCTEMFQEADSTENDESASETITNSNICGSVAEITEAVVHKEESLIEEVSIEVTKSDFSSIEDLVDNSVKEEISDELKIKASDCSVPLASGDVKSPTPTIVQNKLPEEGEESLLIGNIVANVNEDVVEEEAHIHGGNKCETLHMDVETNASIDVEPLLRSEPNEEVSEST